MISRRSIFGLFLALIPLLCGLALTGCARDGEAASPPPAPPTYTGTAPADRSITAAIGKAQLDRPDIYAGALRRPDGHYVVFAADGELDALRELIRTSVHDEDAFKTLEFVQKRWSWADLQDTQKAVSLDDQLRDQGIIVTGAETKPEHNKVEVLLQDYSDSAADEVVGRYGADRVYVSTKSEPPAVA